jgi:integrase
MAREIERLSAAKVKMATAPGMYHDGLGLFLRIGPTGAKSWIFRFADGKTGSGKQRNRDMGLGPLHTVSLAEARERARQQRLIRLDGQDPIAIRKAARPVKLMTFREAAAAYMKSMEQGWSAKSAAQWLASVSTYAYPIIGETAVGAVDKPAVLRVISPIWHEKTETASRVRSRIESVLGWAIQHGHRGDGPNPAAWKGALEYAGLPAKAKIAKVEHLAAMPWKDVPAFMTVLRARRFRTAGIPAKALQFAVLTAARANEVTGAMWSEIDTEARLWVIPADRMKGGVKHEVPLSEAAVELLAGLKRSGPKVFPNCSGNAMPYIMQTTTDGQQAPPVGGQGFTQHGFRSSFRDWCSETGIGDRLAETALAHKLKDATEGSYHRTNLVEQRRPIMQAWADFLSGETTEKVVNLRHEGLPPVQLRAG